MCCEFKTEVSQPSGKRGILLAYEHNFCDLAAHGLKRNRLQIYLTQLILRHDLLIRQAASPNILKNPAIPGNNNFY